MDLCNLEECLDLLNLIEENPKISQIELAKKSTSSLGKVR